MPRDNGGNVMASTHNHEERIRRSMERMKLLRAGGEIDCPFMQKREGQNENTSHFSV